MKQILIGIVAFAVLIGCAKEVKINEVDFGEKQEYIVKNKDNIESVIVHHQTNGSDDCYKVDTKEVSDLFTGIKKMVYSGIAVTDDYWTYTFKSNDGTSISFSFMGSYYEEDSDTFELLNFSHVRLNEEDIVDCGY